MFVVEEEPSVFSLFHTHAIAEQYCNEFQIDTEYIYEFSDGDKIEIEVQFLQFSGNKVGE